VSTSVIDHQAEDKVKWADTDPAVLDIIRARWSPRAFSDRPITNVDLKLILEAARWAASSYNEQPWRFLIARRGDPHFSKFVNLLVPANQAWAKNAQVLLISAAKKTFSHNGSPNPYGLHDAGQAFANMALQATALGFRIHGMGGFDHERARVELGIPDDFSVGAAIAVGYPGSPEQLGDNYRKSEISPRSRKPLDEIVFGGAWQNALDL
jgi:nitroreductase